MILLIDNYDSFTNNVSQYLGMLGCKVKVVRNDRISLAGIRKLKPSHIVISPGPGTPDDAGISLELIEEFAGKVPILGICLGHQAIAQAFGGKVIRARRMMHGKVSAVHHTSRGIYKKIPNPVEVTRYHSLIVERKSLPSCLKVTSETEDGIIMGIKHKRFRVEGIQFHPESYQTESGLKMLENFIG